MMPVQRWKTTCLWLLTGLLLVPGAVWAAPGDVYYVNRANTSGQEDGRSWATAFTTVQPAIELARIEFGGDVWVAKGIYGETRANNGALRLRSGVDLYGGFKGGEVLRAQRDSKLNPTIIDGRKANGGVAAPTVVLGADDVILDGFMIRGGRGEDGAGMTNIATSPAVLNCVFADNIATRFGGAVINIDGATPLFQNCRFIFNRAGDAGGAIANTGAAPSVFDSEFSDNSASNVGGAVFNVEGGDIFLTRCLFARNSAEEGGGAIFNEGASPAIDSCRFLGNSTPKFGGVIFNNNGASPLLVNCVFARNTAQRGAVTTTLASQFTAINCTFAYNTSTQDGSVLFNNNATTNVFNAIIWYNSARPFYNLNSATTIRYSNVGGGDPGDGNTAVEPQFTDAANDDFSIKPTSPCINAGTPNGAPAVDIRGIARPQGDGVDQGAYESDVILPVPPGSCITLSMGVPPAPPAYGGNWVLYGGLIALLLGASRLPARSIKTI